MTPDYMPILSAGAHDSPADGACIMEYASLLAGEPWTDTPACTHPVLARMAQVVNDKLPDAERQKLLPLLGRLMGTAEYGTERERWVLSVRLAVWCARQVSPLAANRVVAEAAIVAAEGWRDGRATDDEVRSAAYAANAAANAANAAYAAYAAADAAHAAADVAFGARKDLTGLLTGLLIGLLDEYDRLTGRTVHRAITGDDLARLVAATA